jgi:UDP-glucuronate 4-epimerase
VSGVGSTEPPGSEVPASPAPERKSERFLVTGILGCIGAWVAQLLAEEGVPVVGYDLGGSRHRLELVLSPGQDEQVTLVAGDITDLDALGRALDEHEITNVVHLAALQVPFCKADPALGARVNVVGTVNVFEAVKARCERIGNVVYASSAAVYDADDEGVQDERTRPLTHYGVYKVANEGTARIYWADDGLPSVAIRPFCVYGPGRDQGLTSGPTLAMLAAAQGEGFHIPFGGAADYQYAPDVARALVAASRAALEGAIVFNAGGSRVRMGEMVAAIEAAAPEVAGRITFDDGVRLPFPEALESEPPIPLEWTPLDDGVRETVEFFRRADGV